MRRKVKMLISVAVCHMHRSNTVKRGTGRWHSS